MIYSRYFKSGHRFYVENVTEGSEYPAFESLRATLVECRDLDFDLRIPGLSEWQGNLPFSGGDTIELVSEVFGVAVRLSARFQKRLASGIFRLKATGDLKLFCRRSHVRYDLPACYGFLHNQEAFPTLHRRWLAWVQVLQHGVAPEHLVTLEEGTINLSGSGLRIEVDRAPGTGDLFLVVLQLEGRSTPVCALSEAVWSSVEGEIPGQPVRVGMRFVEILEEDRLWIDRYIRRRWWCSQPIPPLP